MTWDGSSVCDGTDHFLEHFSKSISHVTLPYVPIVWHISKVAVDDIRCKEVCHFVQCADLEELHDSLFAIKASGDCTTRLQRTTHHFKNEIVAKRMGSNRRLERVVHVLLHKEG